MPAKETGAGVSDVTNKGSQLPRPSAPRSSRISMWSPDTSFSATDLRSNAMTSIRTDGWVARASGGAPGFNESVRISASASALASNPVRKRSGPSMRVGTPNALVRTRSSGARRKSPGSGMPTTNSTTSTMSSEPSVAPPLSSKRKAPRPLEDAAAEGTG